MLRKRRFGRSGIVAVLDLHIDDLIKIGGRRSVRLELVVQASHVVHSKILQQLLLMILRQELLEVFGDH